MPALNPGPADQRRCPAEPGGGEGAGPGDLFAATGAYCRSLASNYNGAMRLPVVFCQDGQSRLVVRRETHAGLLSRDLAPG